LLVDTISVVSISMIVILSGSRRNVNASMIVKVETGPGVDPYREEKEGKLREIGNQAVWSLSSCKPGMGMFVLKRGKCA